VTRSGVSNSGSARNFGERHRTWPVSSREWICKSFTAKAAKDAKDAKVRDPLGGATLASSRSHNALIVLVNGQLMGSRVVHKQLIDVVTSVRAARQEIGSPRVLGVLRGEKHADPSVDDARRAGATASRNSSMNPISARPVGGCRGPRDRRRCDT